MALTDFGGVGPRMFQQLLMRLGPPENLLQATPHEFEDIPRLGEIGSRRILRSLDRVGQYRSRLDEYTDEGIQVTTFLDEDYPELLRQIDDPPPILYTKGNRDVLRLEYVAMVGTTQATQRGLRLAVDLAREFARRGYGIVSGLAKGIDSASHLGALKENGSTIAVLGCGIQNIYPADNLGLSERIARNGLLVSEYQPSRRVKAAGLILRNRLISAFSRAVVVVQVGLQRRGELRTAQYAIKQARPVFYADPEGILDHETIRSTGGVIIDGVDSVDEVIKYMV